MKKFIHRLFLAINVLFAAALIMAYMAVHINPGDFTLPAFFGLAYPYLLLINIMISVIWAVRLRWEALISVAVILAGFNHFTNYIRIFKPRSVPEGSITVMSYNVRLFNYFENKTAGNTETNIISLVRSRQPDIVCLQDLFLNGDADRKEAEIRKRLGKGYYSHTRLLGSGNNRHYGIATFSRYRIVNRGEIQHPGSSSLSIYTDVIIGKDTFRIINNHLQSFRLKKTETSFFEELLGQESVQTLNQIMSVSKSLRQGFRARALQAQLVKDYIDRSPYPVIVAGDFNDTPVSYTYHKIRKGLNDAFVESGYGAGFTYRGNYPPNRIDYILHDNSLKSTRFEITRVRYSDHYPVTAVFTKPL